MSQHKEISKPQNRIVFLVPVRHVKTVKTALERNGQLDRTGRITSETQEHGEAKSARPVSSKPDASGLISPQGQANRVVSPSTVPSDTAGTAPLPALQFDPVSGEYRNPAELNPSSGLPFDAISGHYTRPADPSQFPSLRFDPEKGEYIKPADSIKFPKLQFDPVTGEYRETSEVEQYPALDFDVSSGQYKERLKQPQLEFDPVVGEYRPTSQDHGPNRDFTVQEQRMRIPTTISYEFNANSELEQEVKATILEGLGLSDLSPVISVSKSVLSNTIIPTSAKNPLHKALETALAEIQPTLLTPLGLTVESLVSHFPDSYSVYTPMLLLPHNAFASPPWQTLLFTHPLESAALQPLWTHITSTTNTTHIAINSPIPLQTSTHSPTTSQPPNENILRSPLNITPIHGDFGPKPTPSTLSSPIPSDYTKAFWVTTTQNGIHQTWAPLYTMFSRGNIKEKSRILHLPSVHTAAATTTTTTTATAVQIAADLYTGIGYFAFSYRKAGIPTVLGWELNPWSIEGLRRGAGLNGWSIRIVTENNLQDFLVEKHHHHHHQHQQHDQHDQEQANNLRTQDFIIFQMSNETASHIITTLKAQNRSWGRITHVNLGLLPSSTLSWGTAVAILDSETGSEGWIHAHENVALGDIDNRTRDVEAEFQNLVDEVDGLAGERGRRSVSVQHVERVKMYAPGVAHYVFDVRVL